MTDIGGSLPTRGEFSKHVPSTFRASAPDTAEFDVALVECKSVVDNDLQETFSLLFRAEGETPPDQKTFTLSNGEFDPFDIFLVPVRKDSEGLYFEAVFNRLKDKAL